MLNQAVENLKAGKKLDAGEEVKEIRKEDVTLEIPLSAFIPTNFISDTKEKIRAYQRLSSADTVAELNEQKHELLEEFGHLPIEVMNLLRIIRLKLASRQAGVVAVKVGRVSPKKREALLSLGTKVKPGNILSALRENSAWQITGDKLKIDVRHLGVDWLAGLQKTIEALAKEVRSDEVLTKEDR